MLAISPYAPPNPREHAIDRLFHRSDVPALKMSTSCTPRPTTASGARPRRRHARASVHEKKTETSASVRPSRCTACCSGCIGYMAVPTSTAVVASVAIVAPVAAASILTSPQRRSHRPAAGGKALASVATTACAAKSAWPRGVAITGWAMVTDVAAVTSMSPRQRRSQARQRCSASKCLAKCLRTNMHGNPDCVVITSELLRANVFF